MTYRMQRMGRTINNMFDLSMRDWRVIPFVMIAFIVALSLPVPETDDYFWNTKDLPDGLAIYENNENYVYPPWALIFMQPYRFMTTLGARIALILTVVGFMMHRAWKLRDFAAVALSYFLWFAMAYTNIDLLVFVFTILVWEAAAKWRYPWLWRGLMLPIFGLKPQGSLLLVLYLFWRARHNLPQLAKAIALGTLLIVPISFVGSPPLVLQWLDNISNPSLQLVVWWGENNLSLTEVYGLLPALLIVLGSLGGSYWFLKRNNRWTHTHTLASLLIASMLVTPYSSQQSVIAVLTLVPSLLATGISWVLVVLSLVINQSRFVSGEVFLLIGLLSLWLVPLERIRRENAAKVDEPQ